MTCQREQQLGANPLIARQPKCDLIHLPAVESSHGPHGRIHFAQHRSAPDTHPLLPVEEVQGVESLQVAVELRPLDVVLKALDREALERF